MRMRWVGTRAQMEHTRNSWKILVKKKLKREDHSGNVDVDGRTMLK
jgi:hypothetical protein